MDTFNLVHDFNMLAKINNLKHRKSGNFFLIAGPCAIENETTSMEIAEKILHICNNLKIPFIFKGSYRKANRSRLDSFSGIGDIEALSILKKVGEQYNIPTTTDIHSAKEAQIAAEYVDMLQIPAFLSRQTEILVGAAKTQKIINIKKGQFLSPESMEHAVNKVRESGNNTVMLTERGTMFGYEDLIVDFRGIPTMKKLGTPVVIDVTHSTQKPNQKNGITGGDPKMTETIAKAGIATGADGIFLETHPNPKEAKSDASNMLPLSSLEDLLSKLVNIRKFI